jgi:hypothetical protein
LAETLILELEEDSDLDASMPGDITASDFDARRYDVASYRFPDFAVLVQWSGCRAHSGTHTDKGRFPCFLWEVKPTASAWDLPRLHSEDLSQEALSKAKAIIASAQDQLLQQVTHAFSNFPDNKFDRITGFISSGLYYQRLEFERGSVQVQREPAPIRSIFVDDTFNSFTSHFENDMRAWIDRVKGTLLVQ